MAQRQTKAEKAIDAQVAEIYYRRCSGIEIAVMDMAKILLVGRAAIVGGRDAEAEIVAFVNSIRKN